MKMKLMAITTTAVATITLLLATTASADDVVIRMYKTAQPNQTQSQKQDQEDQNHNQSRDQQGQYIGTIVAKDTQYGLLLIPHLHYLPPGEHGFHVHTYPTCAEAGLAAGGHLDPNHTDKHLGPYNPFGHLGDLPPLFVKADGAVTLPVLAPRLTVSAIRHHALIIHAGSDNYADTPEKLGGGGARLACGIIPAT